MMHFPFAFAVGLSLRPSPTTICKCIYASPMCIIEGCSNRRDKTTNILHCEERGELKTNHLSPAMHLRAAPPSGERGRREGER
jgi:hypothetical protein